jgi:quercetin dioxygenase-like cupin family protein
MEKVNETRLVGCGLLRAGHYATAGQERKEVTITELLSTTVTSSGQPIVLPQKDAQIVVSIYDVAPDATLPVHKHPYPRYGYVLSGELRVTNMETGRSDTYKPGDFILESVGQWHMGANLGSAPVFVSKCQAVKAQNRSLLRRAHGRRHKQHDERRGVLDSRHIPGPAPDAFASGVFGAVIADLFPTCVRYTGVALAYNVSFTAFSGTAPLLAIVAISVTGLGSSASPGDGQYRGFCAARQPMERAT